VRYTLSMENNRRALKIAAVWIILLLALAGTFALSKKLGGEGGNIASVFSSGGRIHQISLYEERAEPVLIDARPGDEILFKVMDESLHNIAEERSSKRDARLESGEFGAGESYSLSFSGPGTFSFYDRMNLDIHVMITVAK
jgi:plastocyanin